MSKNNQENTTEKRRARVRLKRLVSLICCKMGWHNWRWNLEDTGGVLYLDKSPPDCAKCTRCGVRFRKEKSKCATEYGEMMKLSRKDGFYR